MKILCYLGIHKWGKRFNYRGGAKSNHVLCALFETIFDVERFDRQCKRCGYIATFYKNYDSGD